MGQMNQRNLAAQTPQQTIIEPTKGCQLINLRELLRYKDLFYFLVWKEIKVLYKQTVLGLTWAIIRPLATMVIFSVVFGRLAKIPSDGLPYPIFAFVALVPWTYFSTAMTSSSNSLVGNTNLLTKVYFPRLIIPMTPVLSGLVDFGIAFLMLVGMIAWFKITPTWNVVFLPLLILLMICAASGIGMWLSALAIQYRDIKFAVPFLAQLLLYAAPVVWPSSLVPSNYRLIYGLYPMAGVIEGFRSALLGTNPMPWALIAMGTFSTAILLLTGALYFRRMERIFADVA
jgi:lipopolysaccharide transport system permease protein